MSRPSTSKPRGICQYYGTLRGCRAGSTCRFLHGADSVLTPFDQSKTCKFFAQGYCKRGESCWFKHVGPQQEEEAQCNICLERPVTFGLLAGCRHVFCIDCIRQWRDTADKTVDVKKSGVIKQCPLCRAVSRFITPSSRSHQGDPAGKDLATQAYQASMKRTLCIYFEESKKNKCSPVLLCPFGNECFYAHVAKDGSPYELPHGAKHFMRLYSFAQQDRRTHLQPDRMSDNPLDLIHDILLSNQGDPAQDPAHAIEAMLNTFPTLLNRPGSNPGSEDHGAREYERLVSRLMESIAVQQSLMVRGSLQGGLPDSTQDQDDSDELLHIETVHNSISSVSSDSSVSIILPPQPPSVFPGLDDYIEDTSVEGHAGSLSSIASPDVTRMPASSMNMRSSDSAAVEALDLELSVATENLLRETDELERRVEDALAESRDIHVPVSYIVEPSESYELSNSPRAPVLMPSATRTNTVERRKVRLNPLTREVISHNIDDHRDQAIATSAESQELSGELTLTPDVVSDGITTDGRGRIIWTSVGNIFGSYGDKSDGERHSYEETGTSDDQAPESSSGRLRRTFFGRVMEVVSRFS